MKKKLKKPKKTPKLSKPEAQIVRAAIGRVMEDATREPIPQGWWSNPNGQF